MKQKEFNLQIACVTWFRLQYPQYQHFIMHIPNGGYRGMREAIMLKKMGVLPGAPDLFLMIGRNGFHGLFIEMKTDVGKMNENQKRFYVNAKAANYHYAVARSYEQFVGIIHEYLN